LRVAFAGTPQFALPALLELLHSRHRVVGVLTQPDRPRGRGRQLASSPVKLAAQASVPVRQPTALKEPADWSMLDEWRPDVLVVVAYGLILPQPVLDRPPLGCLNVHASLLPRWRGAAPIERALLAGDRATGLTVMRMEAGLDTGPILLQQRVPIEPNDTGASLRDRLADLSGPLLLRALEGVADGTLVAMPQPAEGVTYARKLDKSEARIDWRRPAVEIERLIRALQPWTTADTLRIDAQTGEQERLLVHAARIAPDCDGAGAAPGCIVQAVARHRDGYIRVQCGEGCLDLLQLQRPGGTRQCAGVFASGQHALAAGAQLGGAR
jgi:methionyl-tRNA formyltransferase